MHLRHRTTFTTMIFLVMILASSVAMETIAGQSNISIVLHEPSNGITSADKVTITVTLSSSDNMSSIEYQFCEIDPVGVCSIYEPMAHEGEDRYSAVIDERKGGTTMGYRIRIEYENGSFEYSPGSDEYHRYTVTNDGKDKDAPTLPVPLILGAIIMAAGAVRTHYLSGAIRKCRRTER